MGSRELAIRVPSELGAWVRQQPGSVSETVRALARYAWESRQHVALADPGPGEDRVKFRAAPRVLAFIREATHSRDTTAAVRKLLLWGTEGRALASAPARASLPEALGDSAAFAPVLITSISPSRVSPARENWAGVKIPAGAVAAHPSRGMLFDAQWEEPLALPGQSASRVPTLGSRVIETIPLPILMALPFALFVGGYFLLKWLFAAGLGGKVVATAAEVAPSVAEWTPQAAAGLGAFFL